MRVLVTGGTGFVGFRVASRLRGLGHHVWVTGREREAGIPDGSHLVGWDEAAAMEFDTCFHQAANNDTLDGSEEMLDANVFAPSKLFHRLAANGCRRFVYASSTAVYGNETAPFCESGATRPLNLYAVSKLAFDEFASSFAEECESLVFGLRYCNVYGPGESHKGRRASMIMQMSMKMMRGERPTLFRDGSQKRDWVHVDDVVEANLACLGASKGGIFNVAGGRGISFVDLTRVINGHLGSNLEPIYVECPFEGKYQTNTECDISKARWELGWSPKFTIESGVGDYLAFFRAGL